MSRITYVDDPFEDEEPYRRPKWTIPVTKRETQMLTAVDRQYYKSHSEQAAVVAVAKDVNGFPPNWVTHCCEVAIKMRARGAMIQLKGLLTLLRNRDRYQEFQDRLKDAKRQSKTKQLQLYREEDDNE